MYVFQYFIVFTLSIVIPLSNYTLANDTSVTLVADDAIPKMIPYKTSGKTKFFKLYAEKLINDFDPTYDNGRGKKVYVWGYGQEPGKASMPGPTFEVFEGDRVHITFKNLLPKPTTVHWHGLHLPAKMDGASHHTQKPVKPGEEYEYIFDIEQSGTFMYHTGHMGAQQLSMGLAGFFIAHPKNPPPDYKVDHDFLLMLQIWYIPPLDNQVNTMKMNFNWFTINGKAGPNVPHLKVKTGDRIRTRIANLSMMAHPIHLHSHTWHMTAKGANRIKNSGPWVLTEKFKKEQKALHNRVVKPQRPYEISNTTNVSAGETRDLEFIATKHVGDWIFHCHFLHHITNDMDRPPLPGKPMHHAKEAGMFTVLEVR